MHNNERKKKIEEAVKTLFDCVNSMGSGDEESEIFSNAFMRGHRTLQQCFFKTFIVPLLNKLGEMYEKEWYDLRNEATCKISKVLSDTIKKEGTGIPFI